MDVLLATGSSPSWRRRATFGERQDVIGSTSTPRGAMKISDLSADLRKRSRLGESNPRPTHYEKSASPHTPCSPRTSCTSNRSPCSTRTPVGRHFVPRMVPRSILPRASAGTAIAPRPPTDDRPPGPPRTSTQRTHGALSSCSTPANSKSWRSADGRVVGSTIGHALRHVRGPPATTTARPYGRRDGRRTTSRLRSSVRSSGSRRLRPGSRSAHHRLPLAALVDEHLFQRHRVGERPPPQQ